MITLNNNYNYGRFDFIKVYAIHYSPPLNIMFSNSTK